MGTVRQNDTKSRFLAVFEKSGAYIHQLGNKGGRLKSIYEFGLAAKVITIDEPNERVCIKHADGTELQISLEELAIIDEMISKYGNRAFHGSSAMPEKESNKNDPPKRAEMLLHFGLPKRDRECMIGDLEEEYRTVILPKYGPRVAMRWYWWQAVRSVIAASGGRVRVWLSFGGLTRAAGWIVEKFTL